MVELDLSLNSSVGNEVVAIVAAAMPALAYLKLENTDVNDGCASDLARLVSLRALDLRSATLV